MAHPLSSAGPQPPAATGLTLDGSSAAERLSGGPGDDLIWGDVTGTQTGAGDTLLGMGGDDTLYGTATADSLSGGAGNDLLNAACGNDTLSAGTGDDRVNASCGDDRIVYTAGADTVDGGGGQDLLVMPLRRAEVRPEQSATGALVLASRSAPGDQVTLRNVEHVAFADETTAALLLARQREIDTSAPTEGVAHFSGHLRDSDIITAQGAAPKSGGPYDRAVLFGDGFDARAAPEEAAEVYRLYHALLGRAPDPQGYAGWTMALKSGAATLHDVAEGILNAPEAKARLGALNDAAFVETLYAGLLGRASDSAGLAGWTAALDDGMARSTLALRFCHSAEALARTELPAARFALERSSASWVDDLFRLARAAQGQDPEVGALLSDAAELAGRGSLLAVAQEQVDSPDFSAAYGALDNAAFVAALYGAVLGRTADAPGQAAWTARLDSGVSRAEVLLGFSQSAEFRAQSAVALEGWVRGQGTQDALTSSAGQITLVGGALSDTFVISRETGGSAARVVDLERWDRLDLSDWGFDDAAAARASFTAVGDDLVLQEPEYTLVLEGVSEAMLAEVTLLL